MGVGFLIVKTVLDKSDVTNKGKKGVWEIHR